MFGDNRRGLRGDQEFRPALQGIAEIPRPAGEPIRLNPARPKPNDGLGVPPLHQKGRYPPRAANVPLGLPSSRRLPPHAANGPIGLPPRRSFPPRAANVPLGTHQGAGSLPAPRSPPWAPTKAPAPSPRRERPSCASTKAPAPSPRRERPPWTPTKAAGSFPAPRTESLFSFQGVVSPPPRTRGRPSVASFQGVRPTIPGPRSKVGFRHHVDEPNISTECEDRRTTFRAMAIFCPLLHPGREVKRAARTGNENAYIGTPAPDREG